MVIIAQSSGVAVRITQRLHPVIACEVLVHPRQSLRIGVTPHRFVVTTRLSHHQYRQNDLSNGARIVGTFDSALHDESANGYPPFADRRHFKSPRRKRRYVVAEIFELTHG